MALVLLESSFRYLGLFPWVCYRFCWLSFHRHIRFNLFSFSLYFVLQAKCLETGEAVAIKKVLQDKRYKNRELQIMRLLDQSNVVQLKHCFFSTTEKDELYLNLVLEYISETVYRVSKHYVRMNQHIPIIYVQLYTYQVTWIPSADSFYLVNCWLWGYSYAYSGY